MTELQSWRPEKSESDERLGVDWLVEFHALSIRFEIMRDEFESLAMRNNDAAQALQRVDERVRAIFEGEKHGV